MYTLDTLLENEYPELLQIWESSVKATHLFLKDDDIAFFKKTILENNIFAQGNVVVARDSDNKILGFMGVSDESLDMIFLHPGAIGKGVGRLMMTHAINDLRVTKVEVNEQNQQALEFYEHFGFRTVARSELDGMGKPFPILYMQRL